MALQSRQTDEYIKSLKKIRPNLCVLEKDILLGLQSFNTRPCSSEEMKRKKDRTKVLSHQLKVVRSFQKKLTFRNKAN